MRSDIRILLDAIAFAAHKHRSQHRKGREKSAYINHPISLAVVLVDEGNVEDVTVLQAAVLHDTIEDTQTTYDELLDHFGREVADIVLEVSDDKNLPKEVRKEEQIKHAPHVSHRAALVKLADKICNLREVLTAPPVDWSLERRREYFDWAKRVVDSLPPVSDRLRAIFDTTYSMRP
jgi:GTP diphosphokinase / guanosine-3',5'-bis(diphosphate) 3'-diphosphatase